MASQGQRFRRRALRRGYKVDEVDAFLDRVEATLAGEPVGTPVGAQEVHDVVFRVRFGGYDEWQVDLHLDRVERQIGELEERGMGPRLAERLLPPDRMGPQDRMPMGPGDRMGPPGRMGPPERMGPMGPPERMGPPMRDDRGMSSGPLPPRPMPAQAASGPPDPYGRYDEPTGAFGGGFDGPPRGYDGPPERGGLPERGGPLPAGPGMGGPGMGGPGVGGPGMGGPGMGGPGDRGRGPSMGPDDRFENFEPSRRGRAEMTGEIRMPEREPRGPAPMGGPPLGPMSGPPLGVSRMGGGPGGGGPGMGGPPSGPPGNDLARIDHMRRSFQVRRFGSGYDPAQVDRLFEGILNGMIGRGPLPGSDSDLDAARFGLVPGGYFEAEVDAALREVKDILRRR